MARRVALARAIALDPELVMYDEPFAGLDPISLGTAAQLIRHLNDTLGMTSIVVSHDLDETFRIADQVIILANGRVAAQGTPAEVRASHGSAGDAVRATRGRTGRCTSTTRGRRVAQDFGGGLRRPRMSWCATVRRLSATSASPPGELADLGHGARLFLRLLALAGPTLRRFGLVRDQIHFLGNYSLAIIAVSGLFVGFVLGLQGYYTLQRYGSSEALGLLVALSLVRELGPVVTALLFAGRAGTSLTAEIGLMKAGEQLSRHGDDGGGPGAPHPGAALLGRRHRHAAAGGGVQRGRHHRRLGGRRAADRRRPRRLLEPDAGRRRRLGRRRQRRDQERGVRHHGDLHRAARRASRPSPRPKACRAPPPARWWWPRCRCWGWISC